MKKNLPYKNADKHTLLTPSVYPHIVYINDEQYQSYLRGTKQFYLILELSKENRKHLIDIVKECIEHVHFQGLVFLIDKNEILFDRLFFLQDLVLKFVKHGKYTGIWGVPHCVQQTILGSYYFSRLADKLIPEESKHFSKYLPTFQKDSSLLLECKGCFDANKCDGLGRRRENHYKKMYRTSHTFRKLGRDKLFKTDNNEMQKLYDSFSTHIDNSSLRYADRYFYFVDNLDYGSSYSFSDRFVYHCDFIPRHEYREEFSFLETHVTNKKILPDLRSLADKDAICRLAYSKAIKDNVSRESFYINPYDGGNYYLLNFFGIEIRCDFPHRFLGVGIDFYNGEVKAYKVYYMIPTEVLVEHFPLYLKKIDVDLTTLHEKEHFYIVRVDENKEKISERIDIVYNDQDRLALQKYLPYSERVLDALHIFTLAFEFESMDIKKMNIYYRNRF